MTFATIADCLCVGNRIVEEWLVRDNSAIVWSLGQNPRDVARSQALANRAGGPTPQPWRQERMARVRATPATPFPARSAPRPHDDPEGWVGWFVDSVMTHRRLAAIRDTHHSNVRVAAPGGRRLFGHGEAIGWWAAFLGTFAEPRVRVDHIAWQPTHNGGLDIALRWELAGHHAGPALYGAPSGRDCYVLAVTHWRIDAGKVAREWTVFDEVALLRQIEGGL